MRITIRVACGALLALASLAVARAAVAQEYPTRPITYLMPFAGGSASDVVNRIMLDRMSKSMGRPAAAANAAAAVSEAANDKRKSRLRAFMISSP